MLISRATIVRGLSVIAFAVLAAAPVGALDTGPLSYPGGSLPTQMTDTMECRTVPVCVPAPGGIICVIATICSRHWPLP
jgi:hypothetical protein